MTLTSKLDDRTAEAVERIAARNGTDVTAMLQQYLAVLVTSDVPLDVSKLPPITRGALGMLKGMPDKPYRELLTDALMEKYGLDQ